MELIKNVITWVYFLTHKIHAELITFLMQFGGRDSYEPLPPAGESESIAEVSHGLMGPIGTLTNIMFNVSYVIGAGLLVTAMMRYRQHKRNPNRVRMGEVVWCLILAILLILLPIIVQFSTGATIVKNAAEGT